jgi:glycerophosphoryl diester phosphodiesterase
MVFVARVFAIALVAVIAAGPVGRGAAPSVQPLARAHAHNDYWHDRPLLDALDRGFTSVEADVFLSDGKLLVGHDVGELKPEWSLESLYLTPLARRVRENRGRVYEDGERFFLLVDIKSDAAETYEELQKVLSRFAEVLTAIEGGEVRQGAVTVVITGNRPRLEAAAVRYAGLDGRLSDLESDAPPYRMPMISDNWAANFTWNGDGPMPASERAKLRRIVSKAHAAGRVVRFWATPEKESVWQELRAAGVDLIGTDQLDRLAVFLQAVQR